MSNPDIKNYLDQLRAVLPCVPPISAEPLRSLHAAQDYKGMVQFIKKAMNIADVTFQVFWVTDVAQQGHEQHAPAWILLPELPDRLPFYGTKEFKETSLKIFFRKSFLKRPYDQVAIVIAHELSHVVLDSIRHPLFREEKAVDLTAMLLGFRRLYLSGAHTETSRVGYLSDAEVRLANSLIEPAHSNSKVIPPRHTWLKAVLSLNMAVIAIICILATGMILFATHRNVPPTNATERAAPAQSRLPAKILRPGGMKAALPQELINRLNKEAAGR
jgi:hypothetical protein